MFILADHGTGDRYVIPPRATDEPTIQLLLVERHQKLFILYTGRFRTYERIEEDDAFTRDYVVYGERLC